jgi:hypothetical protein
MDLWVVNHASRRSRMRDVSGPSAIRGPRIQGRFGLSGRCRPKEAVGSGSGTGWEGVVRFGSGQLESIEGRRRCPGGPAQMREDLGDHGGIFDGGEDLQGAAHWGQCSRSISNTRLRKPSMAFALRGGFAVQNDSLLEPRNTR